MQSKYNMCNINKKSRYSHVEIIGKIKKKDRNKNENKVK